MALNKLSRSLFRSSMCSIPAETLSNLPLTFLSAIFRYSIKLSIAPKLHLWWNILSFDGKNFVGSSVFIIIANGGPHTFGICCFIQATSSVWRLACLIPSTTTCIDWASWFLQNSRPRAVTASRTFRLHFSSAAQHEYSESVSLERQARPPFDR